VPSTRGRVPRRTRTGGVRGAVLRELSGSGAGGLSRDELAARLPFARERVEKAIGELVAEGFVAERGGELRIA